MSTVLAPEQASRSCQRVAFVTLGCRANQVESSALAKNFESLGWQIVSSKETAALYVVNTCTVTEQADAEARRLIRQIRRHHPEARFAVTGCYAQMAPGVMAGLDGVDFVIGNALKDQLAALVHEKFWLGRPAEPWILVDELDKSRALAVTASAGSVSRHRASLKIQDGCDYKCTYCIIWQARGPSISVAVAKVLEAAMSLAQQGFQEIVLTGINIGQYQAQNTDLNTLLQALIDRFQGSRVRFRLSSLDPLEVNDALIHTIAKSNGVICPFLHLSAQSVEDGVLKAMARRHHVADFERIVMQTASQIPDAMISADIIVGFPGESQLAFEATYERLAKLPVHHLHVFRYSPRPDTPAASYRPQVPERIRKQRGEQLLALSRQKRLDFAQTQVAKVRSVLVEERLENGYWLATSDNYLKVALMEAPSPENPSAHATLTPGAQYFAKLLSPSDCKNSASAVDLEGHFVDAL